MSMLDNLSMADAPTTAELEILRQRNLELVAQNKILVAQAAALREALLNLSRVSSNYWRQIYVVPVLEDRCPAVERLLLDAQRWKTFWQQNMMSRRTLAMNERDAVEERIDLLTEQQHSAAEALGLGEDFPAGES